MRLWACTRADLRRGRAAMAVLVLMAGLAGGATMAAVAGARRTETSYERLVEAENGADVFMFGQGELTAGDLAELRRIPKAQVGAATIVLLSSAASGIDRRNDFGVIVAADSESLALLRPHHLKGRLPSPEHPEEVVVNELVAKELDVGPGDKVDLVGPTPAAFACLEELECEGDLLNEPIRAVVSGVFRRSGDLDPDAFNGALLYAGPGMSKLAPSGYVRSVTVADVKLEDGPAGADEFTRAVESRFPERFGVEVEDPSDTNISGTLDVEARSLLVFAVVAMVAGLVASAQAFARHLVSGREERRVLAALGLTTRDRAMVVMRTAVLVAGAATVLAVGAAIVGSSFLPIGIARRAEPYPGIDLDGLVLGVGAVGVAAVLALVFGLQAWRAVSRDSWETLEGAPPRAGRLAAMPVVAALGVDLASPRLRRPGTASTIGALVGVIAAVAVATAATVVATSNGDLQDSPELYGQPWDANVMVTAAYTARSVAADLARNDEVTSVALTAGGGVKLVGPSGNRAEIIAVGIEVLEGEMEPALLAGRAPRTAGEVALGSQVFDDLGVAIGDLVTSGDGARLTVVGRAIIPIVDADFPEEGALFTLQGFDLHGSPDVQGESTEVGAAFDVRPGSDLDAVLDHQLGPLVALVGAPARTPSDVTSLAGIGRLTGAIGLFTGGLAVAALSHALLVVVRRRRRDLATLRALGMSRRQMGAAVMCAAGTLLGLGLAVGVPLGIAFGRLVWRTVAETIHVVDAPSFPVASILLVAVVGAVATTAAGAWPTVGVMRLRLSEALRSE